jgi:AbrB family looped-hinge helix DNA binding protein
MIYPTTTNISDKGQLVIPSAYRKALGIKPSGKVMLLPDIHNLTLTIKSVKSPDIISAAHGTLASSDGKIWTKDLLADRKADSQKE